MEAPPRLTLAPGPPGPVIVPEMLYVGTAAVKVRFMTCALLIVTGWLAGVKT